MCACHKCTNKRSHTTHIHAFHTVYYMCAYVTNATNTRSLSHKHTYMHHTRYIHVCNARAPSLTCICAYLINATNTRTHTDFSRNFAATN